MRLAYRQWWRFMLSIVGIICNFPHFLPYFQHWGIEFDHDFFYVSKLSEDQKKSLHQKLKSFCPRNHVKTKKGPNIIQRSDADHSHIIGGMQSNYCGECIPPPPPGFGTPAYRPHLGWSFQCGSPNFVTFNLGFI